MTLPPIRREVLVDSDPATAFNVFTTRIGHWWPLGVHGVFGGESTVAFDGDQIIETSTSGERAPWGTVTDWGPPGRLAFTWHPGQSEERASHVAVRFTPVGPQTLVILEHSGWESVEHPASTREQYGQGWPPVLASYRDDVSDTADAAHSAP